jgi:hypothetical protein
MWMMSKTLILGAVILSLATAAQASVFTENVGHATPSRFVAGTALAPYGWWAPSGVATPIWEQYRKFTASSDSTQPQVTVVNSASDAAGATIYGATVSTGSNGGGLFFAPDGTATPSSAVLYLDQLRHGPEIDDLELRIGYLETADVGAFLDASTKNGDGYVGHTSEADLHPAATPANMQYIRLTLAGMGAVRDAQGYAETGLNTVSGRTEDARTILPVTSSGVPGIPPYRITSRIYDDGAGNKRLEVTVGGWVGYFQMSLTMANSQAFKNGTFNTTHAAPVVYVGKLAGADLSALAVDVYSDAAAPALLSATVLDQTHVQVFFSKPVDRITAENASNYALSGGLTIAAAVRSYDDRSVTLTTSSVSRGATYTVTVSTVRDMTTPPNTMAAGSHVTFTAPPANPPVITSVAAANATHVLVGFSKAVDPVTAQTLSNYAIGGVTISAASLGLDNVTVTLTVSTLTVNTSYTLTANNVQDTDTIPSTIASPTVITFLSPASLPPTIVSVSAPTNLTHVNVVYSTPIDAATSATASNYAIDQGVTISSAALQTDTVTVILTVSTLARGTTYTLTVNNVKDRHTPAATIVPNTTVAFTPPVPPTVVSTTAVDSTHVTVVYSKAMDPVTTATASNYAVTGLTVTGASLGADTITVTLTTLTMSIGVTNTMTISNVRDTVGDTIGANTETFVYKLVLAQYPFGAAGYTSTTTGAGLSAVAPVTLNNVASRSLTGDNGGWSTDSLEWGCTVATPTGSSGSFSSAQYIQFGFTVAPGYTANVSNITFMAQENWGSDTKGMFLESSRSGYANPTSTPSANLFSIQPLSWQGGGAYQVAPYYSLCSVSLTGTAFRNIPAGTTVTFRLYGFSTNTENWALQTDDITVWGGTVASGSSDTVVLSADANSDGVVNGEDYGVWQNGYGLSGAAATFATGDFNGDGVVDGEDYGVWQNSYGRGNVMAGEDTVTADDTTPVPATASGSAPRIIAMAPASGEWVPAVTSLTVVFDSPVQAAAGAVEVSGLATGSHQDYTAAYDAATRTLTLTWASALPADTYTIRVVASFVTGADGGAPLDGELGNPTDATLPSGDGTPGGDAQWSFTVEAME